MKTEVPNSSSSSSTISSAAADEGGGNSCYFPGCRKDANCMCEICQASIKATLDLIPSTSRSKISSINHKRPQIKAPIGFDSRVLSTPKSKNLEPTSSPQLNSTARASNRDTIGKKNRILGFGSFLIRLILGSELVFDSRVLSTPELKKPRPTSFLPLDSIARVSNCNVVGTNKRGLGFGGFLIRLILVLGLVLVMELGFSLGVSWVLKPELSVEIVQNVVEKSWALRDLDGKLGLLQRELQGLVDGKVSDCGSNGSFWKINKDDLLLNSQCMLYKSAAEEVSVWGWPLQTAGLLTAEFSSRSLTILSGRVSEWSYGKVSTLTVKASQSWVHQKWSASVMQLDQNTWIIEYKQAWIVENSRLVSAALEFLKFRLSREVSKIQHEFWFLPHFGSQAGINGDCCKVPT